MPSDWSKIDGDSSVGYTYAFDMCFFLKTPDNLEQFAPEFVDWYRELIEEQKNSMFQAYYKRMPIEKSVVFKFDDDNASMTSPLISVFKDAMQIEDYKDLLKNKTELDTYQLILQEIPKDDNGKPTIDPIMASNFVALVQAILPNGVKTAATPLKSETFRFTDTQTQNNITGTGETNYWQQIGISGIEYGINSNSAATISYSNTSDYLFMKHMYSQFERFVNYQ
jgi:hypothetical protein